MILSYDSELEMRESIFRNIYARTNGGIWLQTANAMIYDSSFFNCTALVQGGGISAIGSHITMSNTVMHEMNAESGAAIFVQLGTVLDISVSQFLQCNSDIGGLIDLSNNSILNMHSSVFDEFSGSAIIADNASVELDDVTI